MGWGGGGRGLDPALGRLTTHPSPRRGRCSPGYGSAAACGPWTWRTWARGGPPTTCSGSFTLATGTSTVSFPNVIRGGRERWGCSVTQGAAGRVHCPGPVNPGRSLLSLSPDLPPQNHPSEKWPLVYLAVFSPPRDPRLLAQPIQMSLYNILLVILSCPAPGRKCGETTHRRWRTLGFFSACHLTPTRRPGCRVSASLQMVQIVH